MMISDVVGVEDSCCRVRKVAAKSYVRVRTVLNNGTLSDKKDQTPTIAFNTKKIQYILKGRQFDIHLSLDDYLGKCNHGLPVSGQGLQTIPRDTRVSGCLCHCATIALETPCHVLCTL